jgi:hypothetical protein
LAHYLRRNVMKIAFVVPLAFVLAATVPQAAIHAQPYQGPSITIPLPGVAPGSEHRDEGRQDRERRERCSGLQSREHELHERMERVGYSEEREHLGSQLRETHEQVRDQCR